MLVEVRDANGELLEVVEYPRRISRSIPAGKVLVHNSVRPARAQGLRGSRFWLQEPSDKLVRCDCAWAREIDEHYRVARPLP